MARDLSKGVAEHNDPNSKKHERDKAEAAIRRETRHVPASWDEIPAVSRPPGNRVIEGSFRSPTKGWCFLMTSAGPKTVPGPEYVKKAVARSRLLAIAKRKRQRGERETVDPVRFKHGLQSMVITLPPWSVRTVESIGPSEREHLHKHLITAMAEEARSLSGRAMFSGAVHEDTAVPHFHLDLEKAKEDPKKPGTFWALEKTKARTVGNWICGADRISREFPGLLGAREREQLEKHLARKGDDLLDLRMSRRLDAELSRWIESRGLSAKFAKEKAEYSQRKRKQQGTMAEEKLISSALEIFAFKKVWPLAYKAMSLTAWRMIPSSHRPAIVMAIRASQHVRKGIRMASGLIDFIDGPSEPVLARKIS